MSATIPFEIQVEIMKRVPVKSLIRFRSVSKQWKSLIDSSEFIRDHSANQTQPHHLLVTYAVASEDKFVSIVDDDSFPHQKFSPTPSPTVKLVSLPVMLGCSHGLVCLFATPSKRLIVVWNPSIRKSVSIVLYDQPYAFGFGVCPKTFDPKMVKITRWSKIHYEAKVFTLRSGAWRTISMNLPHKPMFFSDNAVVIDGVIHWVSFDLIKKNDQDSYCRRIILFDLISEEFGELSLPDSLAGPRYLDISKLKESLVVLDYIRSDHICHVWMKKNKLPLFTKLYTVKASLYTILGFRNNGQLIMDQMTRRAGCYAELQVYEPGSERMNGLGIYGSVFNVASYTESLLLLNHPDSIISDF